MTMVKGSGESKIAMAARIAMVARILSGCEGSAHSPECLSDDCNCSDFESAEPSFVEDVVELGYSDSECEEDDSGWCGESDPREYSA